MDERRFTSTLAGINELILLKPKGCSIIRRPIHMRRNFERDKNSFLNFGVLASILLIEKSRYAQILAKLTERSILHQIITKNELHHLASNLAITDEDNVSKINNGIVH